MKISINQYEQIIHLVSHEWSFQSIRWTNKFNAHFIPYQYEMPHFSFSFAGLMIFNICVRHKCRDFVQQ